MSSTSIWSSRISRKCLISAVCLRVSDLEVALFIDSPFCARRFARADDSSNAFAGSFVGPCVNHQNGDAFNDTYGLPALFTRKRIRRGKVQRVVEDPLGCVKTDSMNTAIKPVLVGVPGPAHWRRNLVVTEV